MANRLPLHPETLYGPPMPQHNAKSPDDKPSSGSAGEAPFGFQNVAAEKKAGLVRQVFERVSGRYDLMNDVMSLGAHRLWKAAMVDALDPRPGRRYLDVAGGTGDIAFRIYERLRRKWPDHTPDITVCDINPAMLAVGRDRSVDRNYLEGILWTAGDAEKLPLPDQCMDAYTIAFGIRNVTHIDRALKEAHRVLRPGGRFLCLEFSHVVLPGLDKLYDAYSFHMIPKLGQWIAKDAPSYQYLVESIRRFPAQDQFAAMVTQAGFGRVQYRNLTGGVVALHSAWRL